MTKNETNSSQQELPKAIHDLVIKNRGHYVCAALASGTTAVLAVFEINGLAIATMLYAAFQAYRCHKTAQQLSQQAPHVDTW